MAEQLEHLIERIHKEAVQKSEAEAAGIVARAREKAAAMVKEAEAQAQALLEKAERDSHVFVERSSRTLEQAARDLLITVGQGVENILADIMGEATDASLDPDTLKKMIVAIAQAYARTNGNEQRIEFLISEKDQAELVRFFADQYRQKLVRGIDIHADNEVLRGFKVRLSESGVAHDFTRKAIAEALAHFLRPHLAEIVHRAAREASNG
jgi:V/A-type H+-transporting ATPase subunit E